MKERPPLAALYRRCVTVRGDLPEPCRIWTGATNSRGYPCIRIGTKVVLVTRLVLALTGEKFTKRKPMARHACDTPRCIERTHLSASSYSENNRDIYRRGRRQRPNTFMEE